MAKSKDKEIFVGIQKPKYLRKEMLEILRDCISLLKKNESMKKSRAERYDAVSDLRKVMNEIAMDLAKLEHMLPKYEFETPKVLQAGKAGEKKPRAKEEEIDLLERELAEVEAKLKML